MNQARRNHLMALALGAMENDQEYRARQTDDGFIGWPLDWTYADAAFIATAKPSVIVQLLQQVNTLETELKAIEWMPHQSPRFEYCPRCGFDKKLGHDKGCALAAALGQEQEAEHEPVN